jgi:hypothetical protein
VRPKDGGILILFGNDQPESLLHQSHKNPPLSAYGSTIPLSTKAYHKPPTQDFSTTPDEKAKQVSI